MTKTYSFVRGSFYVGVVLSAFACSANDGTQVTDSELAVACDVSQCDASITEFVCESGDVVPITGDCIQGEGGACRWTHAACPAVASRGEGDAHEGAERENPDEGGERENPDEGGERENPDEGGERENPDEGGERENPDEGGERENPDEGGERENPDEGGERENPDEGGERENPDEGGERENPDEGSERENPDEGGERESSDRGEGGSEGI